MTAKKFKFISPGVQINEIDRSVITSNAGDIGPVVIGRFQRGPGLVPVTVDSYIDFDNTFGSPTRGVVNSTRSDIWRSGQQQAPTYAAYAAQAWLKNSSPLTVVRVLGVQHPVGSGNDSKAGWEASGGAFGIFITPSGSTTSSVGALAGVLYLETGTVELVGPAITSSVFVSGSNQFVTSIGNDFEFRIRIKDGATTKVDTAFNLNKDSSKYIRKVLNTNPVMTNTHLVPASALKNYWLGETFETFVKNTIGIASASAGNAFACVVPLKNGSIDLGKSLGVEAQPAKSGWIISQDLNSITSSFSASDMPKLFRFCTLGGDAGDSSGEWEQKNIKISIEDIKKSNSSFNKYGSFTVKVRNMTDTDKKQEVLETFSSVNLDPTSQNYIANIIGDKKTVWDEQNQKHKSLGTFDNSSNYIRVEMDPLLEQGVLDPVLLPFGFFNPPKYVSALSNGTSTAVFSGSVKTDGANLTASFLFPTMPLVSTTSPSLQKTYLGVDAQLTGGRLFNEDILDLVRAKPFGLDSYEASGTLVQDDQVFTLDDVSGTINSTAVSWVAGSRKLGQSLTAQATGSSEPYVEALNKINKFTLCMFGGTDGLRITEKDPLRNSFLSLGDLEGKSNYAKYSLIRALSSVADPEVLDMNLLVAPGITNQEITNLAIEICQTRADAMAIIDLEGGYLPEAENKLAELDRIGSTQQTVANVKQRDFNTSYGCAYYPWVRIKDQRENGDVWMPPSVVALGIMASSQETSAVWFAPAGFNRGGLTDGSSGLSVVEVREVLKATQRDDLYEVNINPIARFPSEGIVIFGQKTLQATPSALDRINVRRLVIFLKKQISRIATGLLFDQNVKTTWQRFINQINPLMDGVKAGSGIVDYKVILDETTTTPDLIDRNTMYAKIFIKPAYAIEFIGIDFVITNSGASFDEL